MYHFHASFSINVEPGQFYHFIQLMQILRIFFLLLVFDDTRQILDAIQIWRLRGQPITDKFCDCNHVSTDLAE